MAQKMFEPLKFDRSIQAVQELRLPQKIAYHWYQEGEQTTMDNTCYKPMIAKQPALSSPTR